MSQKNLYGTESELAASRMNEKESDVIKMYKKMNLGVSPGRHSKFISLRRKKRLSQKKIVIGKPMRKRRCLFPDKDYGDAEKNVPDIEKNVFEARKCELLSSM